ncbi:asparagine synthase-related protein [Lyngbya aestuarii]|uniref:asparagine synthase-related protein n=1 Tax=Lyngbya aestuarii TaxID=118322 RepID=UPI00403DD160
MRWLFSESELLPYPSWHLIWGKIDSEPVGCTFSARHQLAIAQAQPAFSPQKQFMVVGDVWLSNRTQLLQRLSIEPTEWSGTDEQLVARLWECWGIECLNYLEGVFALAIWERSSQKLWLVRDRTGARTLYYTASGSTLWVAPRLRTLSPWHAAELDLVALRDYLCCAFVPGERTLWQQVQELRPGTVLHWPDKQVKSYWQPVEEIRNPDKPLVWHSQQLRSLLEQILQEYLPKNEPVGVYLSGGLDSSCVTALAAKFHNAPVHTYSIHFGSECSHELEFSSLVAQHCHTQHHILEITQHDMWNQLTTTMAHLDDPIGDPLTVPNYLLAQLAKENAEVILNGEGGDPCFGGPKNQPMLLNQLYGYSGTKSDLVSVYLASFQKCALDLPQLFQPDVWAKVSLKPSVFNENLSSTAQYLNRLMMLNIKFKGADHILTKVNNLTNSAGLQGRSPLFDQRIVEMAMQIPPEYKLAGAEEKAVLKQAVADLLPEGIIRRPKSGMMVPVQLWFCKYWQRQARALLLDKKAAIAPYLNQALIRDWLNYRGDTWSRYGVKLWLLVSLEIWLRVNRQP